MRISKILILLVSFFLFTCNLKAPATFVDAPTVITQNARNNVVFESGFLIGTALGAQKVEVAFDSGSYGSATLTGGNWKIAVPNGTSTWRDGSLHTIKARSAIGDSVSVVTQIQVRKGVNKDVNGDGYADLVTGASSYNAGTNQGRAYIFHGSSGGIASLGAGSANTILTGQTTADGFGSTVTLGDINGDGYSDCVVGASARNAGLGVNQGVTYIFLSSSSGIVSQSATNANTIIAGQNGTDYFSYPLALGDVNGDGYADLIVGASGYNIGTFQGRTYIFYASSSGISSQGAAVANTILTGQNGNDYFPQALTTGDVNGDGYADVAVGADACPGGTSQGCSYIFHGSASGIASQGAATANTIILGQSAGDKFGILTLGDMNGDGYADLMIGGSSFNSSQGRAYIFYGSVLILSSTGAANAGTIFTGQATSDVFAKTLAFADVNGDGYADALITAPQYNSGVNQGRTYVFHGSSAAATSSSAGSANTVITGQAAGDKLGSSIW